MKLTDNTKILVSDFDFTIMEHGYPDITAMNLQAIKRWRSKGNLSVIASGRSLPGLESEMKNFREYADFLILNDGATIIHADKEKVHSDRIESQLIDDFKDALLNLHLRGKYATISYYGERELDRIQPGCCKFRLWFEHADDCRAVKTLIDERFNKKFQSIMYLDVIFNHDTRLDWIDGSLQNTLEVNRKGTDKKTALDRLLTTICVNNPKDKVIAIGDDSNDLSMLEAYNGYTLYHANEEVIRRIPQYHVVTHLYQLIANQMKALA
ncbi:HAD hydrolase family protein [Candidatus Saccharibacteria bacterium]|nr:HAD hydrolase family protein [Candidatus Saccharibacteria bacterium]